MGWLVADPEATRPRVALKRLLNSTVLAVCAMLLIGSTCRSPRDFFHLARPPADLSQAACAAALGGRLAIELLAWIHGRKFPR